MRISNFQMQRRGVVLDLESALTDAISKVFEKHNDLTYFELLAALTATTQRWVQYGLRDDVKEHEAVSLFRSQAITLAKRDSLVSLHASSPENAETLFDWLESLGGEES